MQPSPLKLIIIGAFGILFFGAVAISFFTSQDVFAAADVERVTGTIREIGELDPGSSSPGLQIWLNEEPLPFRSFGTYPASFNRDVLQYVVPGAEVAIEIDRNERSSPRLSRSEWQQFRNILSLKVGDRIALSLDNYNAWSSENREIGKILLPVMFSLSVCLFVGGLLWRRAVKAATA